MAKKKKEPKPAKKSKHDVKPPVADDCATKDVFPDPFESAEKKPVEVKLPVPHDFNLPTDPFFVTPMPIDPEKVEPLPEPHGPVRCIATKIHGWGGDYIVLAASPGHELPEVSEDGTEADVQFLTPIK